MQSLLPLDAQDAYTFDVFYIESVLEEVIKENLAAAQRQAALQCLPKNDAPVFVIFLDEQNIPFACEYFFADVGVEHREYQ